MNYYYITGTSRGIGKVLAELLLKHENNVIFGISRTCTIKNENYKHIFADFTNDIEVKKIEFENFENPQKIVLINNSGFLGEVKTFGKKTNEILSKTFYINILAPMILMNKFIFQYQKLEAERIILNISSGAARYPIASWSEYCATKAALDMASKVADKEQKELFGENSIKVFSVAPGIVDTKMQDEIREKSEDDFPKVEVFKGYKVNNQLDNPKNTAESLLKIIENSEKYSDVCLDIRNL